MGALNQKLVCAACGRPEAEVAPDPSCRSTSGHQLVAAPHMPGDTVVVTADQAERKRGGRHVVYLRAGTQGTVVGLLRRSSGVWALRVQVRSTQYWLDETELTGAMASAG